MAINYTKTTWVNGQAPALSADNLNKIEEAVQDVCDEMDELRPSSSTYIDRYTLLWTNGSPTAAFESQTVTLTNKSDYDAFEIIYLNYRNDQNGRTTVFVDGETGDYTWCHFVTSINESASMNVVGRYATNTATGLTFSACYLHNMAASSYSPNNDWLIPYKIYGIKEV